MFYSRDIETEQQQSLQTKNTNSLRKSIRLRKLSIRWLISPCQTKSLR
jgi:hypothetical protein